MKHWKIFYSYKDADGKEIQREVFAEANDIYIALKNGRKVIAKAEEWLYDDVYDKCVIWDIGMMEEDVF